MFLKVHIAELHVGLLVYGYVVYGDRTVYMIGHFYAKWNTK